MTWPARGSATRLILVRHTEPAEQADGLCYGSLDVPLSESGRAHAERLALRLADQDASLVLSSPRARALDTAAPIARQHELPVTWVDALRELDFGELEGRTYQEIEASLPDLWAAWMTRPTEVRFPGGESYRDLRARVSQAIDDVRRSRPGQTIIVVAHGGVTRAALAATLGMPDHNIFRLDQRYGAINIIDWFDDTPVVRAINS
ncbi:MAG: alpha-ribazole phosphatase [Jatrophihabitantaceae bacterium]